MTPAADRLLMGCDLSAIRIRVRAARLLRRNSQANQDRAALLSYCDRLRGFIDAGEMHEARKSADA